MISKYFSITGKPNRSSLWPKAALNSELEVGRKVWKTAVFKIGNISTLNKTIRRGIMFVRLWNVDCCKNSQRE